MEKKSIIILVVILVVIIIGGIYWYNQSNNQPNPKVDAFAKCIKDSGAIFYGAFWCPHCQDQKKLFGNSEQYLPYVECSAPDGNSQLDVCNTAKITAYPTWIFKDGSVQQGDLTFKELSAKTGCALPN